MVSNGVLFHARSGAPITDFTDSMLFRLVQLFQLHTYWCFVFLNSCC